MIKRIYVSIEGDVTGVGFRSWMRRIAKQRNISGWVRNANKELVEAVCEGEEESLQEVIDLSRKGPDTAWVENLHFKWGDATEEFDDFQIV